MHLKGELIENRIIVWDLEESKSLFINGYYGKPIGITKPKPDEINAPLILDLIEGYYLLEKSKLKIYQAKKKVIPNEMLDICRREHHNFDKKYLVYKDFRDKGYIVNPGIKFGCDFAVYQKGPGIDHAPYLVQVYNSTDTISATAVVLAGRLATTVRKQFILAIPRGDKIDCLALDWWRA
jgi:tRNA-intron endonuclease, archaea type